MNRVFAVIAECGKERAVVARELRLDGEEYPVVEHGPLRVRLVRSAGTPKTCSALFAEVSVGDVAIREYPFTGNDSKAGFRLIVRGVPWIVMIQYSDEDLSDGRLLSEIVDPYFV